jgi:hypothetical protein
MQKKKKMIEGKIIGKPGSAFAKKISAGMCEFYKVALQVAKAVFEVQSSKFRVQGSKFRRFGPPSLTRQTRPTRPKG